jgi:ribosome-associated protein
MSSASAPAPAGPRAVLVRELPIELCQFLKFGGLAATGGAAKHAIGAGLVSLNGVVETRRGRKLAAGDRVTLGGETLVVQVG